ncbi:CD109 antigen-like [Anopheles arabiensis]|uniref:TEP1-F n=1 Tax=Anopheles arabiensis TaxID=7173 RepID=A0A182I5N6_ANOAR|nr:CD109 antigen-like [Anopheles arabiensis]
MRHPLVIMPWYVRMLVVISLLGSSWGVLVVGPKFVRSNQEYACVISNFNSGSSKVNLMLHMEGFSKNQTSVFAIRKPVDVRRFMSRIVSFDIPNIASPVDIKLTMVGQRGFSFHEEEHLVHRSKSISGLIQIDKPVFRPGDLVKFRAIVLDTELKPPARIKSVNVTIQDPHQNKIRGWPVAKLYAGVFENDLQLAPAPLLGVWNITVQVGEEQLVFKTFEVKEYVLTSYDVQVMPSVIPLVEHQTLNLTIVANYHFGKPVQGVAKVELYLVDDTLDQKKELTMYGMGQVELRFNELLELYEDQQDVRVKLTFTEQHTNRTVVKEQAITVYKHPYRAQLTKESPQFRPGTPFKCTLTLIYHDGRPAGHVPFFVNVEGEDVDHQQTYTTGRDGTIKLLMRPTELTETIDITVSEDNSEFTYTERIEKVHADTNVFLKLELKSPIKLGKLIRLMVTCNERMTFFIYYVVSKGNIVDAGFVRPNRQTKFMFQLTASEKMIPKAHIFVATVSQDVVVWDSLEIDLKQFSNHLDIIIDEKELKPGQEIELLLKGRPSAYVGLAAYDKGLLAHSKQHDLFWEDVMQVFDTFHATDQNEFDVFNSMGLFARLSGGNRIGASPTTTERFGSAASRPISRLVAYRTNFLESWLWQNVSIGRTGSRTVHEVLPDTTTSWYLTGFSIDPVYGLGIIKKPIQFTTVQPFYIVDSLPYSIKRGEAAVLQFTLFNNLGAEYIADVTLYNVANQTEFIERPDKDLSYTKSVSVPPKVGVPISFGVKARKLGEMVVRIKASIMTGKETDAMEKVIRVMPENIMFEKTETRFFSMEEYGKQELTISLDIPKNISTVQIECRISSNLLSPVIHNLDSLLDVPSASGAPSMINFIPPLVVLDYLKAVSSTTTHLIEKATGLLRNGYQLELKYRQRDGSFSNWRDSKGSVFVTALVGTSLEAASKHITEVDLTLVDRLFEWLAAKQHSSGRFDEEQPITYHSLQGGSRNGIALTSFVLIAFLQNTKASVQHRSIIEKGIQYVANQLESIADVYDLSLATYALMLADHRQKSSALNKLIELGIATNETRYWPRHTASIETTAYALLSLVHAKRYADGIMVMHWLVNQQSATGSFPRTQDTFMGIRALAALSEAIAPQKNDYTAIVLHGKARKVYKVAASEANQEYRDELSGDSKLVRFSANGRGFGMLTVAFQYGIDVRNIEHGFSLRLVDQFSNEAYTLQLQVCTSFSPQLMHTRSNLALVEVNFPSGYVVNRKSLVDETRRNPFKDVEVRYGQTSLVIYYETLGPEENCFSVTANRLFRVAFHRQAYVMVHDTYDEKFRAIKFYQVPHDGADIQSYLD